MLRRRDSLLEKIRMDSPNKERNDGYDRPNDTFIPYSYKKFEFNKSNELIEVPGESELKTEFIDDLVLAHSNVAFRKTQAIFHKYMYDQMTSAGLKGMYRVQDFGWPHLLDGNSLFIVSPPDSGRTLTYIPPVCNLLLSHTILSAVSPTYGPLSIIVVPSFTEVTEVQQRCMKLLGNQAVKVVASFGIRNKDKIHLQLLNGCGILVTTPPSFLRLVHESERKLLINFKSLQRLIIDGIDLMFARSPSDVGFLLKLILKLCKNSTAGTIPLQLVVISEEWKPCLAPMIRAAHQPLLLFGDFLEAAVCGRNEITMKMCLKKEKMDILLSFIEKHSLKNERLMIFCNSEDDVDEVSAALRPAGYDCINFHGESKADARAVVKEWESEKFASRILVCTDSDFLDLDIYIVQNVIHYTMAASWTTFKTRFRSQAQVYGNFVKNETTETASHSLILLDEYNHLNFPRLMRFMQNHNQLKRVNPDILAVSERVSMQIEEKRALRGIPLCAAKLEFNECYAGNCEFRHILTRYDIANGNNDLPRSGDIRLVILKIFSPTHYVGRLLHHKPTNAKQWREICRSSEAVPFNMQMEMHYSMPRNCTLHWPLKINDLCIYKGQGKFHRARILAVPEKEMPLINQELQVKLKLIDDGDILESVKSSNLFVCDGKFQDFPPQAVEIRLIGVVPRDNELCWESVATKSVEKWLVEDIRTNQHVLISVNFVFADFLYANNVFVVEKLQTSQHFVYRLNLRRLLIQNNFAVLKKKSSWNLCIAAMELCLMDEDESTTNSVATNDEAANDEAVKDEVPKSEMQTDSYSSENTTDVVDPVCDASSQSEEWCTMSLKKITKVRMRPNNIDVSGNIYVQLFEDKDVQQFTALTDTINQYIDTLKNDTEKSSDYDWVKPSENCIVKFDGRYLRAFVCELQLNPMEEHVYIFFLCDYACFIANTKNLLSNDFLYETRKDIVEFMPYQAVMCLPTGIMIKSTTEQLEIPENTFLAFAVGVDKSDIWPFVNVFSVLLYEVDSDGGYNFDILLNKALVMQGLADFDPDTKHLLDTDISIHSIDANKSKPPVKDVPLDFANLLENTVKTTHLEMEYLSQFIDEEDAVYSNRMDEILKTNVSTHLSDSTEFRSAVIPTEQGLPLLRSLNKHPQISWYQTDFIICLIIDAPEAKKFFLKVTNNELLFSFEVNEESFGVAMTFIGTVQPELTWYEQRGLNMYVRLVKSVFLEWPRLLAQLTKPPWLKYYLTKADIENNDEWQPYKMISWFPYRRNMYDSGDDDNSSVDPEEELV